MSWAWVSVVSRGFAGQCSVSSSTPWPFKAQRMTLRWLTQKNDIYHEEALQSVFDKPLMCVIVVVQLQQSKYPRRGEEGASACGRLLQMATCDSSAVWYKLWFGCIYEGGFCLIKAPLCREYSLVSNLKFLSFSKQDLGSVLSNWSAKS